MLFLNQQFWQVSKNWLTSSCIGCLKHVDLRSACQVKFNLTNVKLKIAFEDAMEHDEFLKWVIRIIYFNIK